MPLYFYRKHLARLEPPLPQQYEAALGTAWETKEMLETENFGV